MTASAHEAARRSLGRGDVVGGRFAIERSIGEGATGVVFAAKDIDGANTVALKVIHAHLLRDRQIKGRFHREARLLGKLDGENLVPMLAFGEDSSGLLYMALELVRGEPLDVMLQRGPIDPERAVAITRQICSALSVAHAANIVHRDLKPGNVIVCPTDGGQERVRVLDFGMAKMIRGDGSDSINALTEQNMVFGTPQYMAPEQARGEEVDARCDIYAAGIMLYEMLTGRPPFDGITPVAVMTAHLVEAPERPSCRVPLPPALEAVVLHALAKKPDERYPTARDLADALERATLSPEDVLSATPPPSSDALADTALDLVRPSSTLGPSSAPDGNDRAWLVVGVVAAVIAVVVGVLASRYGVR